MSDLDKLMNKLNKGKAKEDPKPVEKPTEEDDLDDDLEDDEETPTEDLDQTNTIPVNDDKTIAGEVAVLQNDGIFRRELLLTLKELVDVHKVNTQTLIDLKKKFDEADGTENNK